MGPQQPDIATRKDEHLHLVLNEEVEFRRSTGLERYEFRHEALPQLSLDGIDLTTRFLGKPLTAPIIVSGMTGGTDYAGEINRRIAEAVARLGLGMGVGSQRIALERPEVAGTFQVRETAPDILLIANVGAVQLNYGFGVQQCRELVKSVCGDFLALHLNPLQEAIQPEGNTDFRGLEEKIAELCEQLEVPIIVKEVGCGISADTAERLVAAGASAIDVGGAGGTNWTEIEARRSAAAVTKAIAATFREWGIPTAECIARIRQRCPRIALIASGGLRNGLDMAKCLALGADLCSVAGPVLKAASESVEAVEGLLNRYVHELRLAMFCTGAGTMLDLRRALVER